jgi:hypothetical protein
MKRAPKQQAAGLAAKHALANKEAEKAAKKAERAAKQQAARLAAQHALANKRRRGRPRTRSVGRLVNG